MLTAVAFQSFYVRLSKIYIVFSWRKRAKFAVRCKHSFFGFALEIRYTTSFVKIRFVGSFTKIRVACNPAQNSIVRCLFQFSAFAVFFSACKSGGFTKKANIPP